MNFIKKIAVFLLFWGFFVPVSAQDASTEAQRQKLVIVTGARFSYQLVEKWIDEYAKVNPEVQIIVESRGSNDPLKYDILAEVYEHPEELKKQREYLYIARYAILPVANSQSSFAKQFAETGLNNDTFREVFFHDIFSEKSKKPITVPYTVYTRMQNAGVPVVFASHFGFQQKDIKGTGIAGADSHLMKALLRDTTGVSYLPLPLIYDPRTGAPNEGLAVLPPDLNGNKKVTPDEKFYDRLETVVNRIEELEGKELKNIPISYLHLSVDRQRATKEAVDFLRWIKDNGVQYLHEYGYLKPDARRLNEQEFSALTTRRIQGGN